MPKVYSRATFYRILRRGNGSFWHIYQVSKPYTHLHIEIVGLCKVAKLLEIRHLSCPRTIPAELFIGRKNKSAWLYSSFFKPDGFKAKPIARDSILAATGVSKSSQKRYDKLTTRKVANFAFQDDGKGGLYPILEILKGKKKEYVAVRRLGNIYHSRAIAAPRGMTKKVNQAIEVAVLKDEALLPQRFFTSPKSFIKCHQKHPEPFLLVHPWDRIVKGRLEWCVA